MFRLPEEIKKGIEDYKNSLEDFKTGKINMSRFTGIRVPWGIYSHRGKKVFMNRIRIPAGALTSEQLKAIAYVAKSYGCGTAHITTRQDIQVHGVKIEDSAKVMEYLKEYNLSSRGGGGNTVRNITACVLSGVCKEEDVDVRRYVISLSEYLLRQDTSYNLPRKFKISFSGCSKDCAGCLLNDLGFIAASVDGKMGFKVFVGGGMGLESRLGELLEEFISDEDLGYCVQAVKFVFYKHGDRKNKHHNRLRFLIADLGFTKFKELYQKELQEVKEKEYIALRGIEFGKRENPKGEIPKIQDNDYQEFLRYSVMPQKQNGFSIVKLRIPRGDLQANELSFLAELEKEFSKIEFRTSQNQDLFICWVKNQDAYNLFLKIREILKDFLYPETLLDVVACKGALTCNLGLCNSPGLAEAIEEMLKIEFINTKVFKEFEIKINGCPNSCGQAPVGKIAFYGTVKRVDNRPVPFYKLLLGGKKAAQDTKLAEEIGLIPAKNIPGFLKKFLRRSEELIDRHKDIYEFLGQEAKDIARESLAEFSFVPSYSENKDFYIDWGKTEEFSLEGLGPGECGAGILDMIESDLNETKIAIEEAQNKGYSVQNIKKALFLSSRALLVVKGIDAKSEEEAISGFIEKFVVEGIASDIYSNLKEVFKSLNEDLSPEERKEKLSYTKDFFGHIQQIYKRMDSSFNFPQLKAAASKDEAKEAALLDLKGTPCPMNYVKAKLFLENLKAGDRVEILLDEGEPINNVPKSLESDGQRIIRIEKQDGFYKVIVEKIT